MRVTAPLQTNSVEAERSNPSLGGRLLQRKLTVGASNDPLEKEADEVAERVLAMPQHSAIGGAGPRIQRLTGQPTGQSDTAPASVDNVLASPGRPLESTLRQDMERRFGFDFSQVRVHSGGAAEQSARDLNATAYTVGQNIVFDVGRYAPENREGRRLIAHELAHVVQQSRLPERTTGGQRNCKRGLPPISTLGHGRYYPGAHAGRQPVIEAERDKPLASVSVTRPVGFVQRKVRLDEKRKLDTRGFRVTKSGSDYSVERPLRSSSVWNEIFSSILASPRIFAPVGESNEKVNQSLQDHMIARFGIVSFAAKRRYSFGVGAHSRMNPKYWTGGNDVFDIRTDVNPHEAREDINRNPHLYSIACLRAAEITMIGGSKSLLKYDFTSDETDWVPGDWGYIENKGFVNGQSVRGTSGENIIYAGAGKFWGHTPSQVAYKSLPEWKAEVASWDSAGSKLTTKRDYPQRGLK